jgi:hypothetical protein
MALGGLAYYHFVYSPPVGLHLVLDKADRQAGVTRVRGRVERAGEVVLRGSWSLDLSGAGRDDPLSLPPVRLRRGRYELIVTGGRLGLPAGALGEARAEVVLDGQTDVLVHVPRMKR